MVALSRVRRWHGLCCLPRPWGTMMIGLISLATSIALSVSLYSILLSSLSAPRDTVPVEETSFEVHQSSTIIDSPKLSLVWQPLDRQSDNRTRAVFYNIYIPNDGDNEQKEQALKIVEEQIVWKQESHLLESAPIYYMVIGANATPQVESICQTLHPNNQAACHSIGYVDQGDEGLTLDAIYQYCQNHQQDATQITYLHNKGSFHPSPRNDNFRTFLNRGVMGEDCQEMPWDHCNVCSSRFASFPHYHMAGNMWTATCEYIQTLIPPLEFPQRMEKLLEWTLLTHDPTIPRPTFSQYQDGYPVGRGRFALEHWLCSAPNLRPCDVYRKKYTHGYRDLPSSRNDWQGQLGTAPRFDIHTFLKISMLRGAWFCGQARLLEYAYLYPTLVPLDHFVWKYYLEPYKGCETPLNVTLHFDMFRNKVPNARSNNGKSNNKNNTTPSAHHR